jgi:hypothetical protein
MEHGVAEIEEEPEKEELTQHQEVMRFLPASLKVVGMVE